MRILRGKGKKAGKMFYPTFGDLSDAIAACKTKEDAVEVLRKAKEDSPHAEGNIGYLLGYHGPEERQRLYKLFSTCNHPVFGAAFGRGKDVSPEEAFKLGKEMGEASKKK